MAFSQDVRRIIGIDPGSLYMGFAVIENEHKRSRLLDIGVLNMRRMKTNQERMKYIFTHVSDMITQYRPHEMAIEAPFYGKNVQSMLKLGRAQGIAMAAALHADVRIHEYSPKKIKQSITGNGNATKEQVAGMLVHLIDLKDKHVGADATDALAAAICHLNQSNQLFGSHRYKDWNAFLAANKNRLKGD